MSVSDDKDPRRGPGSENLSWRDDSLPLVADANARNNTILIVMGFVAVFAGGVFWAVTSFGYKLVWSYPFLIR